MSHDRAPRRQRHLLVLLGLTAVAVIGVALVVTGRTRSERATSATTEPASTTTLPSVPLRYLGTYVSDAELRDALRVLDPRTLIPPPDPGSTGTSTTSTPLPAVTDRSFNRCLKALTDTNGAPLGTATSEVSARVAGSAVLVAAFRLPATPAPSASPGPSTTAAPRGKRGLRVVVADPLTCIIRFAIDY